MPRAKRKVEVEETEVEETETKPTRRGRRKAAAVEAKPTRRGRRKAEPEDEVEEDEVETKPARGRRKKAAQPAKTEAKKTNGETKPWQEVEVDDEDTVTLGDNDPRGAVQVAVVEFVQSRGRKKTTVGMVKTHIVDELERGGGYADYVVRNSIYREVLAS